MDCPGFLSSSNNPEKSSPPDKLLSNSRFRHEIFNLINFMNLLQGDLIILYQVMNKWILHINVLCLRISPMHSIEQWTTTLSCLSPNSTSKLIKRHFLYPRYLKNLLYTVTWTSKLAAPSKRARLFSIKSSFILITT